MREGEGERRQDEEEGTRQPRHERPTEYLAHERAEEDERVHARRSAEGAAAVELKGEHQRKGNDALPAHDQEDARAERVQGRRARRKLTPRRRTPPGVPNLRMKVVRPYSTPQT